MNLIDAINSEKPFFRPGDSEFTQWFKSGSGPFSYLVDCDYFVHGDEVSGTFSTSIDLYKEQLEAIDYQVLEGKRFVAHVFDHKNSAKLIEVGS